MLMSGDVDAMIGGCGMPYSMGARPVMEVVGLREGYDRAAGFMIMALRDRLLIFGDTTMNIETTPEMLAEIARLGHDVAGYFDIEPRIAMLSFSNFGDNMHAQARKAARAVDLAREKYPFLIIDGEMHADVALMPELARENFPHSRIKGDANVLIFPELSSGNIAYKLIQRLAGAVAVGPILMGLSRPANILNFHATVAEIVDVTSITVIQAERDNRGD
jgi:malate dehydrogenase (oxaloacetate-decarboxylating)(NADP+)